MGGSSRIVTAGQELTIQCMVVVNNSSLSAVDVTWLGPEGTSLSPKMGVTFSREDELDGPSILTTYSVHFEAVQTSRAGIFTCVAVHHSAYGTIEESNNATLSITVQCKYPVCHEHTT